MIRNIFSNKEVTDDLERFLYALLTAILIARVLRARQHATQNIWETSLHPE